MRAAEIGKACVWIKKNFDKFLVDPSKLFDNTI